jgi:hypothetical protein
MAGSAPLQGPLRPHFCIRYTHDCFCAHLTFRGLPSRLMPQCSAPSTQAFPAAESGAIGAPEALLSDYRTSILPVELTAIAASASSGLCTPERPKTSLSQFGGQPHDIFRENCCQSRADSCPPRNGLSMANPTNIMSHPPFWPMPVNASIWCWKRLFGAITCGRP